MINFSTLRTAIFTGLNSHFDDSDVIVIEANQSQQKPPYPYITILFGGVMESGQSHTGSVYIIDDGDDDIDYLLARNQRLTLSVTSIADNSADAQQNAIEAHEWFKWQGVQHLKDNDIVVAGYEAMTNRDSIIVDQWERRIGFDVYLRVLGQSTRKESWIGQIERERKDGTKEMI